MDRFTGRQQPHEGPSAPVARQTLETSIRSRLAPLLREDGFVGSGRTFRRIGENLICVVQVQGSQSGGRFAVNLGVHPTCMQSDLPNSGDARKIRPENCAFRRRLSADETDQWWSYDADPESMDAAVGAAAEVYVTTGRPAFAGMADPGSPIWTVTPQEFAGQSPVLFGFMSTPVLMARALALMRLAAGSRQDATGFAQHALDLIGDGSGGAGLRAELRQIVQGP